MTFTIEMLPAAEGDSLWIEYGPDGERVKRILIDAGRKATYRVIRERILALDEDDRRFELLVITHVDSDHIEGAVPLLQDEIPGLEWGEIWFNDFGHAQQFYDRMGPLQGEFLSALIKTKKIPWNARFDGAPLVEQPENALLTADFSGMKLTVLTPTPPRLAKLAAEWEKVLEEEGLDPDHPEKTLQLLATKKMLQPDALGPVKLDKIAEGDYPLDDTTANGSTVSLLAEYGGKTALLTGDVWAPVLTAALARLNKDRGSARLSLDVLKVPHHGSIRNMTRELLEQIRCRRYLVSTSGARFNHPDEAAIARILTWGGSRLKLYFNYRSPDNEIWDKDTLRNRYEYTTYYPADGEEGLRVVV